jgi:hypothetical protein
MHSFPHVHLDAQDYSLLSYGKSDGYIFCVLKIIEYETNKNKRVALIMLIIAIN